MRWWIILVGCTSSSSPPSPPPPDAALEIGRTQTAYLKAAQPAAHGAFGGITQLSDDGATLAVRDVSGVEVFRRDAGAWMLDSKIVSGRLAAMSGDGARIATMTLAKATVYTRSGTTWIEEGALEDPTSSPGFGSALVMSRDGSTVIVGDQGKIHTFVRTGTSWNYQGPTTVPIPFAFAYALSANGATLAIGATGDSVDRPQAGAAYVFTRSGSTWSQQARLAAANPTEGDELGQSVALDDSGNTIAVGTFRESGNTSEIDDTSPSSGAVYVFTRVGDIWSPPTYLKAFNRGAGDMFGASVALSGDGKRLVVGAQGEPSGTTDPFDESQPGAGAAYVLDYTTAWKPTQYLKASNANANDYFNTAAISRDGSVISVGAIGEESSSVDNPGDNSLQGAGAVYVYH